MLLVRFIRKLKEPAYGIEHLKAYIADNIPAPKDRAINRSTICPY